MSSYPIILDTANTLQIARNATQSSLNGGITDVALSCTVMNGALFPAAGQFLILIDSEIILCDSVAGNVITFNALGRGFDSTTAVAHLTNAVVSMIIAAYHHNNMADAMVKVEDCGRFWQKPVISRTATVPGSPSNGDRYIVGIGAGGLWAAQDNNIAQWSTTLAAWQFYTMNAAQNGMIVRVLDDAVLQWNGVSLAWEQFVASGGEMNYCTNGMFEATTAGWTTYADAAGTDPVNGTGGAPTVTLTRNATTPIFGVADGLITKDAANRQGEGISYDFTVDRGALIEPIEIEFYFKHSANYASGDIGVFIYDVTNAALIYPNVIDIPNVGTGLISRMLVKFNPVSTSQSYRLIYHIRTTNATAYTFNIDKVTIRPNTFVTGAAISDWKTVTFTGTWTTNTTYSAIWRRVGDSAEIQLRVTCTGAPDATYLQVQIPTAIGVIDTAKFTTFQSVGVATANDAGIKGYPCSVMFDGTWISFREPTGTGIGSISNTVPFTWGNTDFLVATIKVPIVGWSSNINLVQSATEYAFNTSLADANDATSFGYGAAGTQIQNTTLTAARARQIRFTTPIAPDDVISIEISSDRVEWYPIGNSPRCGVAYGFNSYGWVHNANADFGIGAVEKVNATDISIAVGQYKTYTNSTGVNWSASCNGVYWRVRKSTAHQVGEYIQANYSTTEQLTGARWIDGKPIYRRVFTGTTQNASPGTVTTAIGVSVDAFVNAGGYAVDTGANKITVAFADNGSAYVWCYITSANNLIINHSAVSLQNVPYYIWVEYTKV